MPNHLSQLLCMDTIRNANNQLDPGERAMLACENTTKSSVKAAISIHKDLDSMLWIELSEHSLSEKIIGIYSDPTKRQILLLIDKPVSKDEILKKCGKSQSSIYRKFNELLRVGFIVPVGYTKAFNRVRVYDKIISKAEFSVSTKISQIRLQINLLRLPEPQMEEPVYP